MNISLTPELTEFIKKQVSSGMYASDSEVIRHGMRLLVEQEKERERKLAAFDAMILEGLEGPSKPWNKEAFLAKMNLKNNR